MRVQVLTRKISLLKITEQNFLGRLFNKRPRQYGGYNFPIHKQVLRCARNFCGSSTLQISTIYCILRELIIAIGFSS